MKLEDLLGFNAEEFSKLSEAELVKLCEPYFNITRPELATKPINQSKITFTGQGAPKQLSQEDKIKLAKRKQAMDLLAKMGIKI